MEELEDFDVVFGKEPDVVYDPKIIDQVTKHRRLLENTLFFDRLLGAIGVEKASQFYPPKSNHDLRALFDRIAATNAQEHHKYSIVYYILKDLKLKKKDAASFARTVYLPERYRIFIDGIWCLDRLVLEEALDYLTEPCLIPTFSEEILYTLARNSQNNHTIALQYYHTVSPIISSTKTLDEYFKCLCRSSITEAFFFARSQHPSSHRRLFELMLAFVHGSSSGDARSSRGIELVGLPFDEEEADWFEDYLLRGKGKGLYGAKDTMIMRQIAMGDGQRAENLSRDIRERRIDGMNWITLAQRLG